MYTIYLHAYLQSSIGYEDNFATGTMSIFYTAQPVQQQVMARTAGVQVPAGARFFSFPYRPDRFWEPTHPPIQSVPGAISPGREDVHSPPTTAEIKE
jgi:hypothetical protein